MEKLEAMADFFAARVDMYDEHMLEEVEGCRSGYIKMAELVPISAKTLLDLGCGTGLELDFIFKRLPEIEVTGIDLSSAMLGKLKNKHPDKNVHIICDDYFSVPFPKDVYDCAVSFQTMHHFPKEKKLSLYRKIYTSLKEGSVYIECDYMVETQSEEDFRFAENERIRREQGIPTDEFYHYDTPCTIENQIELFKKAGFKEAKKVFREENTTIIIAEK